MTGYRTDQAPLAAADAEGWEPWLSTLGQVFPDGMRWPWAPEDDRSVVLRVAVHEFAFESMPARTARRFTMDVMRSWSFAEMADDATLAVCELVTNAVRHGLRHPAIHTVPVRLLLFRSCRSLLCVVTDPSNEAPVIREPDHVAETGRGLQVVAGVSRMWGWTHLRPTGKAVWAGFCQSRPRAGSLG
ncbi:ATP-binding protein [Microbispora sp. RL4-1S]|uniref:ATP-binding protein n=1 Tax=Microbispora oryzae TaxID=2806554 RepID=A0A940WND4_9ACTN|nr:ATP-binding protein [Microbispora oryzae]MBP2706203.1 ATP-binding protein [Microbispora oryzae]